jgi:hypothetical protein
MMGVDIVETDVLREAKWLRDAGHTYAASMLEALWSGGRRAPREALADALEDIPAEWLLDRLERKGPRRWECRLRLPHRRTEIGFGHSATAAVRDAVQRISVCPTCCVTGSPDPKA